MRDAQHSIAAPQHDFSDILLIDVDEQSMALLESQLGPWPYDRDVFAAVTGFLADSRAKSIVYDVLFSEPRQGDDEFARAIRYAGNVALATLTHQYALEQNDDDHRLGSLSWEVVNADGTPDWRGALLPNPKMAEHASIGSMSVLPDSDGLLRRMPLAHNVNGHFLPSLSVAALFPGPGKERIEYFPSERRVRMGEHEWSTDDQGFVILQIPENLFDLPVMPFYQLVLAAAGASEYGWVKENVRDKIVFIGSSTAVLGDYAYAPIHGRVPGLGLLALTYADLAHNRLFKASTFPWNALLVLIAITIPLALSYRYQTALALSVGVLVAALVAVTINLVLLKYFLQESALLYPLLSALLAYLTLVLYRMKVLHADRQRLALEKLAADEANRLKGQFLSHITHELRTPLTAIMGYNGILREKELPPNERKKNAGIINSNAQHLMALINNLLDQSKLEAGQMSLDVTPVHIRETATAVHDTFSGLAGDKGIALRVACDEAVPEVLKLDQLRVRQILINLIGNAVKFTDQGSVNADITWADNRLRIVVQDTGPGMTETEMEKIFEPFQQTSAELVRSRGGSGLGLAITHNLIDIMGGDIEVESKPGKGTKFSVEIPAEQTDVPTPDPTKGKARLVDAAKLKGTVLVVDDNPDILVLAKLYLDSMGLSTLFAETGHKGIEIALREQPDTVLMDMLLPDMDGEQAVTTLRKAGFAKPILAFTAHDAETVESIVSEIGCNGIVAKPIDVEQMRAAVENVFDSQALS